MKVNRPPKPAAPPAAAPAPAEAAPAVADKPAEPAPADVAAPTPVAATAGCAAASTSAAAPVNVADLFSIDVSIYIRVHCTIHPCFAVSPVFCFLLSAASSQFDFSMLSSHETLKSPLICA